MATSRRVKASLLDSTSSASLNPFDSSDDESAASHSSSRSYVRSSGIAPFPKPSDDVLHRKKGHRDSAVSTNPFDDDEHPPPKNSSARQSASTNPFDDEEHPPVKSNHVHKSGSTNPFDDDEPGHAVTTSHRSRRASSEERTRDKAASSNRSSASGNNPFDDEEIPPRLKPDRRRDDNKASAQNPVKKEEYNGAFTSDLNGFQSMSHEDEESYRSNEKSAKSDRKTTNYGALVKEKMSHISDGVAHGALKLKEGTIGQFKARSASDGNLIDGEKPIKSGYGNTNSRDLLFEDGNTDLGKKPASYSGMQRGSGYESRNLTSAEFESQSVQELESYALHKSQETTSTIYNCLKVAEDTKEVAVKTTLQLHEQGEQIRRTHGTAVEVDLELSRGEKLLGSLGGLFSKNWKPKKTRKISGPVTRSDSFKRKAYGIEQRAALGLTPASARGKARHSTIPDGSQSQAQTLIEVEKSKQDDALSDLSNVLDQLKEMTLDMGKEIEKQSGDLDNLDDDVTELGYRIKGANERGRKLLHR